MQEKIAKQIFATELEPVVSLILEKWKDQINIICKMQIQRGLLKFRRSHEI